MAEDIELRHDLHRAEERQRFFKLTQHQLIRMIGGGAYGKVWLALSITGAYRAVKIVFRKDFKSDTPYEREYKGILKFEPISRDHDGFIDILHVGRDDEAGYFYYVMELGDDAEAGPQVNEESYRSDTLDLQRRLHRRIPFEKCLQFSLKLTLALGAMHKAGLVHRDIKPQNIIFVNGSPKLADIGLVTDAGLDVSFVGTEGYVPPEGPGEPAADIYSLGKTLYEITTGNDRMEFPELPEDLLEDPVDGTRFAEFNEVLVKACETDPASRYQSAEEMHAHLALLQAGKSVRRLLELERWRNRIRRYLPATLVSAAAVTALFVLLIREQQRTEQARQEKAANATGFANNAIRSGDYFSALPWLTDALEADAGDPKRERDHRLQLGSVLQHSPRVVQRWPHRIEEGFYVTSLQFRPGTEHVLLPDTNGLWAFFDVSGGERVGDYLPTQRMHDSAMLSSDGKRAVLCGFRSGLEVWDFEARRVIFSLIGPKRNIRFATFNPAGDQILLARSTVPFAQVVDLTTGMTSEPFQGLVSASYHFTYNNDGSLLALSSGDGVRVWAVGDWELVGRFSKSSLIDSYQSVFYPKGNRIATCGNEIHARVWNVNNATEVFQKLSHNDGVASIDISPDGRLLVTGSWDKTVRLWNTENGQPLNPPMRHNHRVMYVRFCPRGCHVISCSYDGVITAWKLNEASPAAPEVDAIISTDGRRAAWIANGTVSIQDLLTSNSLGTVPMALESTMRPMISDDGSALLVPTHGPNKANENTVQLWNIDQAAFDGVPFAISSSLTNTTLSANSRFMAAYTGTQLQAIDTRSGEVRLRFETAQPKSIRYVAFDHTASHMAIATNNGVALFNQKTGTPKELASVTQTHPISWIEFSPDDKVFVTAGASPHMSSSYAQIWSTASGRPIGPPLRQTDGIYCARFSPNGKKLVTTSEDFSAVIWDAETGQPFRTQHIEHGRMISYASFSSDSQWIITAGRDSTARIWDAATGSPLALPFVHPSKLRRAYFAAGDSAIVTRDDSGRTWYWKLPIETKPLPDLITIAKFLSARQASYTPPEVYMTNDTVLKELRRKYPDEFGAR